MKTNANNSASQFVVNENMLNEKKALKYINKEEMLKAINEICAAIKELNSAFSPVEYSTKNSKNELFQAYGRFYIVYTDLKEASVKEESAVEKPVEEPVAEVIEEKVEEPVEEKPVEEAIAEEPVAEEPVVEEVSEPQEKAEPKKRGNANERLIKYSEELANKEACVADAEQFSKLSKEDQKAIKHRIASLKRKIERANKALSK